MISPDVLIIDDDDLVRDTIRDILEEQGHSVAEASDGRAGLQAIRALRPRLIICDIRMPGLNGYEVLQELQKSNPKAAETPFVFLSGLDDSKYVKAGYKVGADDYVTKPVDYDVLQMKVDAILRKATRPAEPAAEAAGDPTAAGPGMQVPAAFQTTLARLMKSEGSAAAGRLKLVTLEEFHKRFGDRWPKVRGKAMAIAEMVIKAAVGKGELYTPYGEDAFLILFSGTGVEAAQLRAEKLAVEIRRRLLGEDQTMEGIGIAADTVDVAKIADLDPAALARTFDTRATEQAAAERAAEASDDSAWFKRQLSVQFRPMWSPGKEMVVAFECYPFRRASYGIVSGSSVLHGGDQDPFAVHLDRVMAEQAARAMMAVKAAANAVILLPLHFSTLKSEDNGEFGAVLRRIPEGTRRRRLAIEIIGVPENRGEATIRAVTAFVKDICGIISVRLAPEDRHASVFKANGVVTFVLDVDNDWHGKSEQQILTRILDFGNRAKAQDLRTVVHGLNTLATVRAALSNGYGMIGGRAIGDVRDVPAQPYELTKRYILS